VFFFDIRILITPLVSSSSSEKGSRFIHVIYIYLLILVSNTISQQPENCENRNDSDLVQAFLKKWWVESDFKAPNLQLSLRFKGSGCHYNSIYNNAGIK
jgi:hypothetical protein